MSAGAGRLRVAAPPSTPVVIVEDDDDIRTLLIMRLQRLGYRVLAVGSAEVALETLGEVTPCLVLLEIVLPGMDGWAVYEGLRASATTAQTPVLVTSILGVQAQRDDVTGVWYLAKPFVARSVERMVAQLAPWRQPAAV